MTALVSAWLWLYVNKTASVVQFKRAALIYVTMFFSLMMYAISLNGVSITIFTWVLIIPLISYLLLGLQSGFIITAIFYAISTFLFFGGYTNHPVMAEKVAYANMIVCALLFWRVSHSYEYASQSAKQKLRVMAVSDYLTGLYNRITIQELFDNMVEQAEYKGEIVSLVLFDLDNFKTINDQFGHEIGDQVLIKFARILKSAVSGKGEAFRIGGEEFAVIFSAHSDLIILSLAENIRRETEKIIINEASSEIRVSVSAGVATSLPDRAVFNELMETADRRMYHGKNQGRNVVIHKG